MSLLLLGAATQTYLCLSLDSVTDTLSFKSNTCFVFLITIEQTNQIINPVCSTGKSWLGHVLNFDMCKLINIPEVVVVL